MVRPDFFLDSKLHQLRFRRAIVSKELMCEAHDKVLVDGNGDELRNDEKKSRHGCNGCGWRYGVQRCSQEFRWDVLGGSLVKYVTGVIPS